MEIFILILNNKKIRNLQNKEVFNIKELKKYRKVREKGYTENSAVLFPS